MFGVLSRNDQMTLKVKVSDPHFQYQLIISQDACSVQIWYFKPKTLTSYCADQLNFLEFWVQNGQNDLECQGHEPNFKYQPKVSQDAFSVQI